MLCLFENIVNVSQSLAFNNFFGMIFEQSFYYVQNQFPFKGQLDSRMMMRILQQSQNTSNNLTNELGVLCTGQNLFEHFKNSTNRIRTLNDFIVSIERHSQEIDCASFHTIKLLLQKLDEVLSVSGKFIFDIFKFNFTKYSLLLLIKLNDLINLFVNWWNEITWTLNLANHLVDWKIVINFFKLVNQTRFMSAVDFIIDLLQVKCEFILLLIKAFHIELCLNWSLFRLLSYHVSNRRWVATFYILQLLNILNSASRCVGDIANQEDF